MAGATPYSLARGLAAPAVMPPDRQCAHCGTLHTPLWRRSPLGPKTLCNACGVRMKKGRLAFINGSFVAVESAAATAKRLRAAGAASTPAKSISKPQRARASSSSSSSASASPATAAAAAAAAAAASPTEDLGGIAVRTPTGSTRPLTRHRSETGLYSLLDAIEYIEYQKPA